MRISHAELQLRPYNFIDIDICCLSAGIHSTHTHMQTFLSIYVSFFVRLVCHIHKFMLTYMLAAYFYSVSYLNSLLLKN